MVPDDQTFASQTLGIFEDTSTCLAVQVHGESDSAILPELPNEGLRHATVASKPNTLLRAPRTKSSPNLGAKMPKLHS